MIDIVFSFFLSLFGLFLLLGTKLRFLALDRPNERSLHTTIIPRTGGLAIMSAVLIIWVWLDVSIEWVLLPVTLIVISLIDDIRGLKIYWRFIVQVIVCAIFLVIHPQNIALWLLPLVLVAMVWMVNLYNFMDGSDGLAGGMALFGFGAYAAMASSSGYTELAVLCASVASASFAFLLFNFHPAKIFMGDSGSVPLGFLAAALGLWGWQQSMWPLWFPFLVFSPFIMDATITLLKRLMRGEQVWQAHRSHYYQRLIQVGWGHKKTALAEYILMIATSSSALFLWKYEAFVPVGLFCWLGIYALLMWKIDQYWQASQLR